MQYGTKGERVGELAFESAAEATAAERDSRTLDYLITVIGFGLCRAWIVFCLGSSQGPHPRSRGPICCSAP